MAKATTKSGSGAEGEDKAEGTHAPTAKGYPRRQPAKAKGAEQAAKKAPAKVKPGAHADDPENKGVDGAHKGVTASPELAEIIGEDSMKRTEVVSRVWDYVRKHNLQNPEDKREIIADEKLKKVFGRDRATMFEMNKLVFAHLK